MPEDKVRLLKGLRLLEQMPEKELSALSGYLRAHELSDGEVVFEEGSQGESLFFVAAGNVRISKAISGKGAKDLALLAAGDCFGEMALLDPAPRSAKASAVGRTALLELDRKGLDRWLRDRPLLAMGFFADLVQVQSRRLRRTSNEVALLYDLSKLFLEPARDPSELASRALERLAPYLEGSWSALVSLYNVFNEELETAAARGGLEPGRLAGLPALSEARECWLDERTYYAPLPGPERPLGYAAFRWDAPVPDDDRADRARTLSALARLLASAIENLAWRNEDKLRDRLRFSSHGTVI